MGSKNVIEKMFVLMLLPVTPSFCCSLPSSLISRLGRFLPFAPLLLQQSCVSVPDVAVRSASGSGLALLLCPQDR